MMDNDLKRVNIRVSNEVHQYFKEKSIKTGVSMSSLMFLALEEYMHDRVAMNNTMPDLLKVIHDLQNDNER